MKALLMRVGIDSACGRWNGPVDPTTRDFVYVPIPETCANHADHARLYAELSPVLARFCAQHDRGLKRKPALPPALQGQRMHLDPDFEHLTYGDKPNRSRRLHQLERGDWLVFYAGLRSILPEDRELVYALIGLYVVAEVVSPASVPPERWGENAHTRRTPIDPKHVIVRAQPERSGRLATCLPFGEWRNRAYRVRTDLLAAWGGLSATDGYVTLSGVPPWFTDPERFSAWFQRQSVPLVHSNHG